MVGCLSGIVIALLYAGAKEIALALWYRRLGIAGCLPLKIPEHHQAEARDARRHPFRHNPPYVAKDVFDEKGGGGDVRDYSEPEAGLGGPGPSGDPFEEGEEHLAGRYPNLWRRFGAKPLG